jgi:hypothetical protein
MSLYQVMGSRGFKAAMLGVLILRLPPKAALRLARGRLLLGNGGFRLTHASPPKAALRLARGRPLLGNGRIRLTCASPPKAALRLARGRLLLGNGGIRLTCASRQRPLCGWPEGGLYWGMAESA